MNHKKLIILGVWVGLIGGISVLGRELPLQDVSLPECKGQHRQELGDECKVALDSPREQSLSQLLISAIRGGSYTNPHDPDGGSHPSADFATNLGTPVYAVNEGRVIKAKYIPGFGNSISVLHDVDGETIYSNYSHLSVINVRPGQRVEGGMKIGEVGRSGFSIGPYGYHLDFQLTTAESPSHPYGFHDCKEGGYIDVVNNGLCQEKLERYTINPLEFFKTYMGKDLMPVGGTSRLVMNSQEEEHMVAPEEPTLIDEVVEPEEILEPTVLIVSAPPVASIPEDTVVIKHATVVNPSQDPTTVGGLPDMDISRSVVGGGSHRAGSIIPVQFTITKDGEPVSGALTERVVVKSSTQGVAVLPGSFKRVLNGKKTIFVKVANKGDVVIAVSAGENVLGEIAISVQ